MSSVRGVCSKMRIIIIKIIVVIEDSFSKGMVISMLIIIIIGIIVDGILLVGIGSDFHFLMS